MRYKAVVFDLLGTIVDEVPARRSAVAELLSSTVVHDGVVRFAEEWEGLETEQIDAVAHGRSQWSSCDEVRADALRAVASHYPRVGFVESALRTAALFGRDARPWPDSVRAVDILRSRCPVFALTNGSRSTITEMSSRTKLTWTELVTADDVGTFKPDARMYERLETVTAVDASTAVFVAAHPWDLDGARRHGYRTALVRRPGVVERAMYDHDVQDLNGIVSLFIGGAG